MNGFCSQSAKTSLGDAAEVTIKETFCLWKVYTDKGDEDKIRDKITLFIHIVSIS